MIKNKFFIGAVTFVVIILVIFVFYNANISGSIYYSDKLGINFSYPNTLELVKGPVSTSTIPTEILYFSSPEKTITIVALIQTPDEVEKEKKFYESVLFKDPTQVVNSHTTISGFQGYKSNMSDNNIRHTVYGQLDSDRVLIVRTDLMASSTKALLDGEETIEYLLSKIPLAK